MNNQIFNIARDFSMSPGPRFSNQGPMSGELLRRQLVRLLKSTSEKITVVLDGTRGFGSSFLDEAFGGLIRAEGFTLEEIRDRISFVSEFDPTYILEINESLESAVRKHVN